MRSRSIGLVGAAVASLAVASACSATAPSGIIAPGPTATSLLTTSTVAPDLSGVTLAAVPGRTTTTVAITGGQASLSGTVNGPPGTPNGPPAPVPGAEVHIERITTDGVASTNTVTGADGSWSLSGLLGGRYRVRAWRAPDLDLTTPDIFFLAATDARVVPLTLSSFTGTMATAAVNPTPVSGIPFNIAVVVSAGAVDTSGIARATPMQFAKVQLNATSDMVLDTINPGYTDATGRTEWEAVCQTPGPLGVSIVVNDTDTINLNLPVCQPAATTSTTPTTGSVTPTTG
jgi:hypothetical protein